MQWKVHLSLRNIGHPLEFSEHFSYRKKRDFDLHTCINRACRHILGERWVIWGQLYNFISAPNPMSFVTSQHLVSCNSYRQTLYLWLYCRCFDWPLCLCKNTRYNTAPPEGCIVPVCMVSSCYQSIFLTSGKRKIGFKQTLTIATYGFYTANPSLKWWAESWVVLSCLWTVAEASPDGLWPVNNQLNE